MIAWDQPQVTESSLLIVLCAKVNTWEVDAKRVWDGASPEVQDIMVGAIDQYYRDRPQTQRDEVMRSAGIFAQTLMLLAQEHGLDSCPMDGFDFDAMAKLINLPEDHVVCLMIAVGKSASEPYPRVGKLLTMMSLLKYILSCNSNFRLSFYFCFILNRWKPLILH